VWLSSLALSVGSEQVRALGLYGATLGLANIVGPILGGVLVSSHPFGFIWQAIFLINVPIGRNVSTYLIRHGNGELTETRCRLNRAVVAMD
jgi:MFS family permease